MRKKHKNMREDSLCKNMSHLISQYQKHKKYCVGDDAKTSSLPPHIPSDLMEEILCRLPVKYLLELRCVCKSWNSLIFGDSKFAKKHLHFSTFCHDRHHLAVYPLHFPNEFQLFDSPISSFFSSVASSSTFSFTQLNHPVILNFEKEDIVERTSTCNGIICFKIDTSLVVLFNPSIKKFSILPRMEKRVLQHHHTLVYDRFSNNHKIITLTILSLGQEVNIHTLGTDYWRKIEDFPSSYYNFSQRRGIFVSGTVNWLVYDTDPSFRRFIIYFDLKTESCQELWYPLSNELCQELSYSLSNKTVKVCLESLKDCLCFFFHNEKFFDIWIMKEYGNEKSWSKLLRIPYIGYPGCYHFTKALYIYEDDQVLVRFVDTSMKFSLAVYDSKKNDFKILEIQDNDYSFMGVEVYVESLMSP